MVGENRPPLRIWSQRCVSAIVMRESRRNTGIGFLLRDPNK